MAVLTSKTNHVAQDLELRERQTTELERHGTGTPGPSFTRLHAPSAFMVIVLDMTLTSLV